MGEQFWQHFYLRDIIPIFILHIPSFFIIKQKLVLKKTTFFLRYNMGGEAPERLKYIRCVRVGK